jgi:hypothetical protein
MIIHIKLDRVVIMVRLNILLTLKLHYRIQIRLVIFLESINLSWFYFLDFSLRHNFNVRRNTIEMYFLRL